MVQATGVDENTLASTTDDLSCECGYVSDFKYKLTTGKLTDVLIQCKDVTTDAVHPDATSEHPPARQAAPLACPPACPPSRYARMCACACSSVEERCWSIGDPRW